MQKSKKWSTIALVVTILAPVVYFASTGQMSGLRSSVLDADFICTKENVEKYTQQYDEDIARRSVMSIDVEKLQSKNESLSKEIGILQSNIQSFQTSQKNITKTKKQIQSNQYSINKNQKKITKILGKIDQVSARINAYELCRASSSQEPILPVEATAIVDLPIKSDDQIIVVASTTSVGNDVVAPVNGGWGDNDLRAHSVYVLQKSCTNPIPANGGTNCANISGWTVFNAGGYQLARTCTNGGTNGRMIDAAGEQYFWCDAPVGFNNDGTAIANTPAAAGYTADMTQYWPWPVDGTAFIKIYNREDGNPAKLIQKHTRSPDGTYMLQDVYYHPDTNKYEWHSTWHYRLDPERGVVEFRDDLADVASQQLSETVIFVPGNEILHGKTVKKGTEVTNPLQKNTGTLSPGSHMWFQVFEIYSDYYLQSKKYNNVVAMNIKQLVCADQECNIYKQGSGFLDYTHFYLAPYIGSVKHVYYANNPGKIAGEANLVQYCTTSADKWSCD